MQSFEYIVVKLEAFIKKFYVTRLVRGILLFLTLSIILIMLVTGVEYLFWLSSRWRLALFIILLIALVLSGYHYIVKPLMFLFKVRQGIGEKEASKLIGKHFPAVGDKLLNLFELSESKDQSDLLLASIEQRSKELHFLPFSEAVNFKDSLRQSKYLVLPLLILGLVWISGNGIGFLGSYKRVLNYDVAYEQPAPFQFVIQNESLEVLEDRALIIQVQTIGSISPENVLLITEEDRMVMQNMGNNTYQVKINPPLRNFSFRFEGNEIVSRQYNVKVGRVPSIIDFKLNLEYPAYLDLKDNEVKGTGNVTVPEGTRLTWELEGMNTEVIDFITKDTTITFSKKSNSFKHSAKVYKVTDYEINTSNDVVKHYESLGYQIKVVQDEYPRIRMKEVRDSLRPNELYFSGVVSDDYQVNTVDLVYYKLDKPGELSRITLVNPKKSVSEFYYTFPSGLSIKKGIAYEMYFEVKDNDGLRGGKTTKSGTFRSTILSDKQLEEKRLDAQSALLRGLTNSLQKLEKQNKELKEIRDDQKEIGNLQFDEKERLKAFLNKQKREQDIMERFSNELKENIKKNKKADEKDALLKERLERQELEARKNKKLLDELEKIADKINQEQLQKRLEELAKAQNSGKRNLEQLLELTKRYYVKEKAVQLAQNLEELAKDQLELSKEKKEEISSKPQSELNQRFEKVSKELNELKSDNRALRKPLELKFTKNESESIKKDQQEALDEIIKKNVTDDPKDKKDVQENKVDKVTQKQQSAAEKIKELSKKLQDNSSGGGGSSGIVEDAEMLRQILDNLISFSFKQESLFNKINENLSGIESFSQVVREQKELRRVFEHVDDSLFALSLRRVELSEFVNEQITEVFYNVDKSLDVIAENQLYQAASYQQYVLTASNALADFLAKILDNMQESMNNGQGQGQGKGFQLPDIIKKQEGLKKQMGDESGGSKEGEKSTGKSGESGDQKGGENGKNQGKEAGKNEGEAGKGDAGSKEGNSGGKGNGKNEGDGNGQGSPEDNLKEIYEIYKEQQSIRLSLESQLRNIIENDKRELAKKLVQQMEDFEDQLLENGITKRTQDKINRIQQDLLKLENATLRKGKRKDRESKTNTKSFEAPVLTRPEFLKAKGNELEILNRQVLPLRQNYRNRIKRYFGKEN